MSWTAGALTDPNAALWASIRPPQPLSGFASLREHPALAGLRALAAHLPFDLPAWEAPGQTIWRWSIAGAFGLAIGMGIGVSARPSDDAGDDRRVARQLQPAAREEGASGNLTDGASERSTAARGTADVHVNGAAPTSRTARGNSAVDGTARDDAPRDGTAQDDSPRSGTAQNDAPGPGMLHSGTVRGNASNAIASNAIASNETTSSALTPSGDRASEGAMQPKAQGHSMGTCSRCLTKAKLHRPRAAAATRRTKSSARLTTRAAKKRWRR